MIAIKEWSADRSFKAKIDKTDTRVLTNEVRFALFPLSQQLAGAFLSLRGTSRKTKLIEIHENFIRNSEASVKPGVVLHIKQFLLVFFFPCPHACGKRHVCDTPTGVLIFFIRWLSGNSFAVITNVNLAVPWHHDRRAPNIHDDSSDRLNPQIIFVY